MLTQWIYVCGFCGGHFTANLKPLQTFFSWHGATANFKPQRNVLFPATMKFNPSKLKGMYNIYYNLYVDNRCVCSGTFQFKKL